MITDFSFLSDRPKHNKQTKHKHFSEISQNVSNNHQWFVFINMKEMHVEQDFFLAVCMHMFKLVHTVHTRIPVPFAFSFSSHTIILYYSRPGGKLL